MDGVVNRLRSVSAKGALRGLLVILTAVNLGQSCSHLKILNYQVATPVR